METVINYEPGVLLCNAVYEKSNQTHITYRNFMQATALIWRTAKHRSSENLKMLQKIW